MKRLVIRIMHGHRAGEEFILTEDAPLTVGREQGNDIVILDKSISRNHCAFSFHDGEWEVEDCSSRNGILVNEERVSRARIRDGDILRLGSIVVKLIAKEEGEIVAGVIQREKVGQANLIRTAAEEEFLYNPDPTVEAFLKEHRHESAVRIITWPQVVWYLLVLSGLGFLLLYDPLYFLTVVNIIFASFYIVSILYKLTTVVCALVRRSEVRVSAEELAALKDEDLPVYTILVPLYHEKEVTEKVLAAIDRLDYPGGKLDVKLLLEADDEETLAVCRNEGVPDYCEIIIVPDVKPKTKPRACNHGLAHARGEFLVIYDAEDRPDPDQLKKAVAAFGRLPEIPCFQSKLNYFNQNQNFLTRWFTVEYTAWFDLFLPGLHLQDAPIPLGGTSNHFRVDVLREVGGWDPFNVTEDADLGVRLYKCGYRTRVLDSTTWEEANSRVFNWIRQRSRWIKGYIQTHLVHMRNPLATMWRLGILRFFSFVFTVGGMALMMLLNPIYWAAAAVYGSLIAADLLQGRSLWNILSMPVELREGFRAWQMIFVSEGDSHYWSAISVVFFGITLVLLSANLFFIVINFLAARRRRLKGMLFNNLLSPLYWLLISVAAWKGFLQLFYKPFYWEKTEHGFTNENMEGE